MIMTMILHIRTSVGAVPGQVMPGSMFRGGNSPWSKGALTYQPQNFELHNTKYKIQNTKYKIQNSKYKIQNTKYKIQNTKYKIQNTKIDENAKRVDQGAPVKIHICKKIGPKCTVHRNGKKYSRLEFHNPKKQSKKTQNQKTQR